VLAHSLPGLWRKWLHYTPHAIKHGLTAPTAGTGVLALFGLWQALRSAAHARLALAGLLLAVVPLAVIATTEHSPRYVTPFLPLWALAAAVGASGVAGLLPAPARRPRAWIGGLALLAGLSTVPALAAAAREARVLEARLARERAVLRSRTGARAAGRAAPVSSRMPMFSDAPDFVAWTTGRPVVWLEREEYLRLPTRAVRGESAPSALDLPTRGAEADTWFHSGGTAGAAASGPGPTKR
jgi:hypothetical protein